MIKNKKTLIFHFYLTDDFLTIKSNRAHFACWEQFYNVFDKVCIIISINDINNTALINQFENLCCDIFKPTIQFKIKKNNKTLRECETFKEEVIDYDFHDNDINAIFFGHNKGITNEVNESLTKWIAGMYYFNLSDINDVENKLIENQYLSYGAFKHLLPDTNNYFIFNRPLYKWWYSGTFFWINKSFLNELINKKRIVLPILYNRWYVESFIGNIISEELGSIMKGTNKIEGYCDFYNESEKIIEQISDNDLLNKFNTFYDEIKHRI